MKQFTFFIFTGQGGISALEFVRIIIEVLLSFTYHENSEIKVTVKLTGSTVKAKCYYYPQRHPGKDRSGSQLIYLGEGKLSP